ncbi:hypothetical protein [Paenibacillus alvei]|uniref:hypothetical protein n=1 Tax=Paenibacillus alvei TaxID=44250 RepID=UPI0018CF57F5|nr:hypothetical protein [Paenibacillus alvei]MBG9734539.1 hypothetical protein [Paenibacillus alvei]MBG9743150.1 hypothetical protein [Paenibacillus alvei]MCY9579538.1 hypothetical protein [Paenibacillus alvei]MCY9586497.1 hypothetical protein [Paenibacillus alvei]
MSEDYKEPSRNNVILFPKTHDYYQIELTRMLESERYGEAIALLQFLLTCDGEDARIREEWDALLQWLVSAFPEAERDARELDIPEGLAGWTKSTAEEESEETEQDILRRQFQQKLNADGQYMERLLATLADGEMDDRKLLVLEQLAAAEDAGIEEALVKLLKEEELSSLLQFGILQVLKRRGMHGEIRFPRGQEWLNVRVEDTPLDYTAFPAAAKAPAERVNEAASVREPSLAYFAQELWQQYVKHIYGSSAYEKLCEHGQEESIAWAAALHFIIARMLHIDEEVEVKQLYGIRNEMRVQYELALRSLNRSLRMQS